MSSFQIGSFYSADFLEILVGYCMNQRSFLSVARSWSLVWGQQFIQLLTRGRASGLFPVLGYFE